MTHCVMVAQKILDLPVMVRIHMGQPKEVYMPMEQGKDSKGCYVQWGNQKKYYYECGNEEARQRAIAKAKKQEKAIRASGWSENK